jgi:hypothetical protein
MKYVYYVLASFGMWLARRFGSVRPGEVLVENGQEKEADYSTLLAIEILRQLSDDCADYRAREILGSSRYYLETGRGFRMVAGWWASEEAKKLIR